MPRKKVTTTVYLDPEQKERLAKLHAATRVPVAEYIREGIDLVLAKHEGATWIRSVAVSVRNVETPATGGE